MIEAASASLLYLPPYSVDFNPVENAFAKLRALLRQAAERTVDGLWSAIGGNLDRFQGSRSILLAMPFNPFSRADAYTACGSPRRLPTRHQPRNVLSQSVPRAVLKLR